MSLRLLVISDDEFLRRGVRHLIDHTPGYRVVGEATASPLAVDAAEELKPDLMLIDWTITDPAGLDLCRQLVVRQPAVKVVLWASMLDGFVGVRAAQAGAAGCIPRRMSGAGLIEALARLAAGQRMDDLLVASPPIPRPHRNSHEITLPLERLSPQEQRVLPLLADGLTNRSIATALGLSEKTIKNYLTSVYIKLGISRRTEAVRLYIQLLDHMFPDGPRPPVPHTSPDQSFDTAVSSSRVLASSSRPRSHQ